MPKISIIIPVCNAEKYIDHCLNSVVSQTITDIEILLMAGVSKDNTLEKCIEWQKKDQRIVLVSRKDTSLGDARNFALKLARGKYIAYLDADDFYSFDYLEKMCSPLDSDNDIEMTCCGYNRFEGSRFLGDRLPVKKGSVAVNYDTYLSDVSEAAVWMKMFRRDWLIENQIEMFDGCCEDQALHYILAALIKKVFFIQEVLYHYNVGNEESLVRKIESITDYAPATEFAIDYLKGKNLYDTNRTTILNRVCQSYKIFFSETDDREEVRLSCRKLMEKYFPEVLEDYYASKNPNRHIKGKIILYGAGNDGEKFLKREEAKVISYIVDKNPLLQGNKKSGLPIKAPQDMYNEKGDVSVIVASSKYYYEIVKELRGHGITSIFKPDEFYIAYIQEKEFKSDKEHTIILFNTPSHANIGDHMIAEAEKMFFRKYLPSYHVVEVTGDSYKMYHSVIRNQIKKEDVIVITGGGFLGTLWMDGGEGNVREIMREYTDYKIIIFPQSIFFDDTPEGKQEWKKSQEVYNTCKNLKIFLREKASFDRAVRLVKNEKICFLAPDIVLSAEKEDFVFERKACRRKAAVCLKKCKESIFDENQKEEILGIIKGQAKEICYTSMLAENEIGVRDRSSYITDKLSELSGYEIVITDMLHCMIFCAITKTPCVALNNISGKVKGVYDWIKTLSYIEFANSIDDIEEAIETVKRAEPEIYGFDYSLYADLLVKSINGNDMLEQCKK